MTKNKSTKEVYAIFCRYFTYITLAFTLTLGIDYLLPTVTWQEIIIKRKTEEFAYKEYGRKVIQKSEDTSIIETENFVFPAPRGFRVQFGDNDSITIFASPILRLVKSGIVHKNSQDYPIKPYTSIFDIFFFVPVLLFLTSALGFFYRNEDSAIIDFGTFNIILFFILLKIMRIPF